MSKNGSKNQVSNNKICVSKNNDNIKSKNSTSSSSVYGKGNYGFGFSNEKPFSYDPLENFPLFK
jgi:hypothetical protein